VDDTATRTVPVKNGSVSQSMVVFRPSLGTMQGFQNIFYKEKVKNGSFDF
jgi:hypothetical protein